MQNKWMGRPRGHGAHDLRADRQIVAHDAILEKADPLGTKGLCNGRTDGGKQE